MCAIPTSAVYACIIRIALAKSYPDLLLSRSFEGEWSGPAGTKENPTVVESVFNHRIVGIPRDDGHGGDAGEAKWFHLHAGEAIEMDGQWFVLKQVSDNVLPEFERSH